MPRARTGATHDENWLIDELTGKRLGEWFAIHLPELRAPFRVKRLIGGQSNPTYRIDSAEGAYILRRKPFGTLLPSAHAIEREFRLLGALHPAAYPVARPLALCSDEKVIGANFCLMEYVEGSIFWNGALPEMTPDARTSHYNAMIDVLADLHAIDPVSVGLENYGRPQNYFERQVARWIKQYRLSQTDALPEIEKLIAWLPGSVPRQGRTAIVHGDFRIDNLIFATGQPKIRAVLDWELSTIGDPLADLSYFLTSWITPPHHGSGVMGLTGAETGIPTMEDMVERYCRSSGRDEIPDLDWYLAYNLFRMVGIVQGIKKRDIDGNASSETASDVVARLPELVADAWSYGQRAGAG
jgi:aminoglycoside phosphotransferase (APT) family kinase protein